jgi:hypothetical protein
MIGTKDSGAGMAATPQRETQVCEALKRLTASIEYAEKAMQSLANRIGDVLAPCPPGGDCDKEPKESVPLAGYIREMTVRVERLANFIEGTEQRVEL